MYHSSNSVIIKPDLKGSVANRIRRYVPFHGARSGSGICRYAY